MLTAYLDDSGTHDASKIVLVAGVIGSEARMSSLSRNWKRLVDSPLEGRKPSLRRFHAYDCDNSTGEFLGWSRTETDYFTHLLREAIIEADVAIYGAACVRELWDELITGPFKDVLGNAEGFSVRNCFVRMVKWAVENSYDDELRFVFDNRPSSVQRDAGTVYDAYARYSEHPKLCGVSFESSYAEPLLQVADLAAWEVYQHVTDVHANGPSLPKRAGFKKMASRMPVAIQMADRASIQQMLDEIWLQQPIDKIEQLAKHFREFDPKSPDYKNLLPSESNQT